ncbi:autotransporter outer membrane beta-barrel domain-containing protein [Variovorax fucosicus]|uniref:autotransporter outer membrane beta-barrel domain-containing protein n=1 Tax=Variovorax fucosicus TaxID=3053517 RepID=UPI0025783804|nr:autotransporter outer membrane beta-barrel domain-containing protein [Variovorax sp. J22G47]MDM0058036.1 autotransporter outer membrane beta-barrel domain-containing protein [Variovorax sp. J22G47]
MKLPYYVTRYGRAPFGLLAAPLFAIPAFAANECGAPVAGVVVCGAPDKAGVSYSSPTTLDVRLNPFNITTTGLSVAGTAGASITAQSVGSAIANINSTGVGVNLTSTGGSGNLSLIYNNAGTIKSAGNGAGVSATAANAGAITIAIGAGSTINATGAAGAGILAQSATGNVSLTSAGTISSVGGAGVDLRITGTTGTGKIAIQSNGSISGNTNAISATNASTGGVEINTAAGTNLKAGTQGINAVSSGTAGGIAINALGTVGATAAVGGVGILANITKAGNTAAIDVTTGGAIVAVGDGIRATNTGAGNVAVGVGADITSATGYGLRTTTTSGDILVGVAADITGKNGISATTSSAAGTGKVEVAIGPNATVTATNGNAVAASSAGTSGVTVTTGTGTALQSTGSTALSAGVTGTAGAIGIETRGTVNSVGGGNGIAASISNNANPGNIDIATYAGVAGASTGISATTAGIGNVTITANDTVTGNGIDGVVGTARKGGNVNVTTNALVTGQRNGLSLGTAATGNSTANVNANVTGVTGEAISAVSGGLGGTVVSVGNNATLTAGRFGILALAGGDGSTLTGIAGSTTVTTGANVAINAATWNAIEAAAYGGGNVSVTTGTGSMSGTNAIYASTSVGAGTLKIDTSGNLTGTNAIGPNNPGGTAGRGIWAEASGAGGIDIKTAEGAVITANTDGILATNSATSGTVATSAIKVDAGSAINAANGSGIKADIAAAGNAAGISLNSHAAVAGGTHGASLSTAGAGSIDVTNSGALQGLGGAGLSTQTTTGNTTINNSGLIAGTAAGVSLSGGPAQLENAGTIRNLSGTPSALAIRGTGGATTINNTGLVTGTVLLGDMGNSFTNAGTWNTSGGTSDFGAGTNAIVNAAGGTIIAAQNASVAETTTFARLASFTNRGTLTMADGAVGDRTIVAGNYFSAGGTLRMDVDTQALKSDLLVLNGGAATGSTAIVLNNIGTTGAMTTGNGIELVDTINGATTSPAAFRLGTRVAAGAYEYLLYRGGNTATGGNADDQNFYLRSTLEVVAPTDPTSPTDSANPAGPTTPKPPVVAVPNYRNEVFVDMAVPSMASSFGLAMLGTLDDRRGDTASPSPSAAAQDKPAGSAGWGRAFGEFGRVNRGTFSSNGPSYDFNLAGFQTGLDLWQQSGANGARDAAGIYVGAGRIDSDVNNSVAGGLAGRTKLDGYSLGAYWTHFSPQGWYTDTVLQGTRYDPISASSLQGQTLKSTGSGLLASLEGGYRLNLGDDWSLTPQAQLIYQRISLKDGADAYGRIGYDASNMGYARIGAKLSKTASFGEAAGAQRITFWARANIWHGFGGDAATTFTNLAGGNAVTLKTNLGDTWANLGVGVTTQISRNVSAFVLGDYNVSVGRGKSHGMSVKAGFTARW